MAVKQLHIAILGPNGTIYRLAASEIAAKNLLRMVVRACAARPEEVKNLGTNPRVDAFGIIEQNSHL